MKRRKAKKKRIEKSRKKSNLEINEYKRKLEVGNYVKYEWNDKKRKKIIQNGDEG